MKKIFLILLLAAGSSCFCQPVLKSKKIKITVIDNKTNLSLDCARVSLISIIDSREVFTDVKYTAPSGFCSFSITPEPSAQYQVVAAKKGYLSYFDAEYVNLVRSSAVIDEKSGDHVVLYLTSDSMNHVNYWAKRAVRFDLDTLITLLKSNKYPDRSNIPLLFWTDIPGLLTIGDNRIVVDKYPISVLSSGYTKECYLGIISLWFIESARITELRKIYDPTEKFPSLTPTLRYSDKPGLTPNTPPDL